MLFRCCEEHAEQVSLASITAQALHRPGNEYVGTAGGQTEADGLSEHLVDADPTLEAVSCRPRPLHATRATASQSVSQSVSRADRGSDKAVEKDAA